MKTAKSAQEIVQHIKDHITKEESGYRNWYCGVTQDVKQRLFIDHNVSSEEGKAWWVHDKCQSHTVARTIEQHFLELGCKGHGGGGDDDARYVYAYKITSSTRE